MHAWNLSCQKSCPNFLISKMLLKLSSSFILFYFTDYFIIIFMSNRFFKRVIRFLNIFFRFLFSKNCYLAKMSLIIFILFHHHHHGWYYHINRTIFCLIYLFSSHINMHACTYMCHNILNWFRHGDLNCSERENFPLNLFLFLSVRRRKKN